MAALNHNFSNYAELNNAPIIGILTQPSGKNEYPEYVMAAYVRFVEQAGARAVPISYKWTEKRLWNFLEKVNGVLLPGGDQNLILPNNELTPFCKQIQTILRKVKQLNKDGIYLPIWAVCQGFQAVAISEAPFYEVFGRNLFDAKDFPIALKFKVDTNTSIMHTGLSDDMINAWEKKHLLYDTHHDGIKPELFQKYEELRQYRLIATAKDRVGAEFIAAYEHSEYPIYCVQFHPEKSAYVWLPGLNIPRFNESIELSTHYSNMYVREARKNSQKFSSIEEEEKWLITNWPVKRTQTTAYEVYCFEDFKNGYL